MLRGKHTSVPFLRKAYESNCLGNDYVTTLHAINSAVVKMSALTVATKVYRGSAGLALPDCFLKPDKFAVKGGIEYGFMSTSRDVEVARQYADKSGKLGLIFEILHCKFRMVLQRLHAILLGGRAQARPRLGPLIYERKKKANAKD